ncbi:MAG TPA: hypothetical protein VEX15_16595 [Nocardioidaceae bacterium]|nr:hypothetical protein [Nocardioidaceae bacterium]
MELHECGATGLRLSGKRAEGPLSDDVYAAHRPSGPGSWYVATSPHD